MADNKKINNDPYDELKGYFPEGLDLSPEELEKEIATENKQCDIALNMTAPKTSAEGLEPEEKVFESLAANDDVSQSNEDDEEALSNEIDDYSECGNQNAENGIEEPWIPPVAKDVTENELLNKYESLDELLDELESNTEDIEEKNKEDKLMKAAGWTFDFLEVFAVCMACIILIFTFFARLTKVDGPSMENTLHDGQYLIISDFAYTPKAGDIVVLQNTSVSEERLRNPLVKRIIAVGGQTIDITSNGKVTVTDSDGTIRELDQSFTKNEPYMRSEYHCVIPEGYVFVMGDNRNDSTDSRDPRLGVVDERCIFGRALFRVLPFGEFAAFSNPYNN